MQNNISEKIRSLLNDIYNDSFELERTRRTQIVQKMCGKIRDKINEALKLIEGMQVESDKLDCINSTLNRLCSMQIESRKSNDIDGKIDRMLDIVNMINSMQTKHNEDAVQNADYQLAKIQGINSFLEKTIVPMLKKSPHGTTDSDSVPILDDSVLEQIEDNLIKTIKNLCSYSRQYNESHKSYEQMKTDKDTITRELEDAKRENSDLSAKSDELNVTKEKLNENLESINKINVVLQKEIDRLNKKNTELKDENVRLKNEHETLKEQEKKSNKSAENNDTHSNNDNVSDGESDKQ
jgi:chromosome segregation ATPase